MNEEARFLIPQGDQERLLKSDTSSSQEFIDWRVQQLKALTRIGLPSAQHEMWRYTRPDQFDLPKLLSARKEECRIVQGLDNSASRSLPQGVSLQESFKEADSLVGRFRSIDASLAPDAVAALQLSGAGGVRVLRIAREARVEEPIFLLSELIGAHVYSSVTLVQLEAGSSATLIQDIRSDEGAFYAPRIEFLLEPNSRLNLVTLQRLSPRAAFLGRQRFHLMRDANLQGTFVALGGQTARVDIDCVLHQPGASATISSLYLAAADQHTDFHTNQLHLAPHCYSNLLCKGVLKDNARGVYYGFIRVAEAAQKTDAYQKSRDLLLSPHARADAIPNLEIKANDVKCSHGATVGQVQLEELFYLMSRGLTRPRAEELLVEGFLSEVLGSISSEHAREIARTAVMEKLHGTSTIA